MLDLLEGPGFGVQQKSFQPLHMVYVGPILGGDLSYPLQPLPKQSYCPARVFSCQLALHLRFRRYLLLFGTNYWTFLASVSGPLIFPKKSKMPWKGVKHLSFFQGIYLETFFDHFWLPFWELILKDPETSPFSISIFPFWILQENEGCLKRGESIFHFTRYLLGPNVWTFLGFRFGKIWKISRHLHSQFLFFTYFEFSKKIKGALRGLKAPFILQATYLEKYFEHSWLLFWGPILKDSETSPFQIFQFESSKKMKGASRGLKVPFILRGIYYLDTFF